MDIFRGRPLALASFLFVVFTLVSFFIDRKVKLAVFIALALVLVIGTVVFILKKRARNAMLYVILAALFVCISLFSSYRAFDVGYHDYQKYVGTEGIVRATVEKVSFRADYGSFAIIKAEEINGCAADTEMMLECEYMFDLEVGDIFVAEVVFAALEDDVNGYSEKLVGVSRGRSLVAISEDADSIRLVGKKAPDIFDYSERLRGRLDKILCDMIGKEDSGIARAILLANTEALPSYAERDMRAVGVTHLLALSGMHLTILIGNIDRLLILLCFPKKPRLFVLLLLTCAYVILTGMQLSMVRSAIMLFMAYLAFWLGRERDMLTSLMFSVALICLVMPGAVFDVGLELSALSMLGIAVFDEPISNFFERAFEKIPYRILGASLSYVCLSISVTLVAVISVLPCVWFYFGETSLIAALGNLLLSPFADAILFLSPLVLIFCKIPFLGGAVAFAVRLLSNIMLSICADLAKKRGVMMSLRYPFAKYIVIALAICLFILLVIRLEKKWLVALPVVASVIAFSLCLVVYTIQNDKRINAVFLSDGNNDGFVAISDGRALLCDISSGSYRYNAVLALGAKELATCDIEVYMLTHMHERHIVTFDRLSDGIYIRNLWLPLPQSEDEEMIASALIDLAKRKNIDVHIYDSSVDNELDFEDLEIELLHRDYLARSTQPVICLSIENDRSRLTYVGASLHESELYESACALVSDSDAIVFGIHGPRYKSAYSYEHFSEKLSAVVFSDDEAMYYADTLPSGVSVELGGAYFNLD